MHLNPIRVHYLLIFFVRSWVFEVWADKARLLGNLSITTAIAAFLHISFVFNLVYPQVIYFDLALTKGSHNTF